jgi:ssRNA-specific RNase YbeY (16S rRNA maturation enzyme)
MFQYSIVHPPSFSVDESRIEEIFRDISIMVDEDQNGTINIAFVSDEEMQKLNLQYRGKDSTTDVLSFHYYDDVKLLSDDDTAGEILMSESRIALQAIEH